MMRLNSFQLKCIAIVTMLIDHVGAVFFPEQIVWRYIGRLSFPIFCFLLAEGFAHTKNVQKYMLRLGIFALISEIPYDLAFRGSCWDLSRQNVFFTLFVGIVMLYAVSKTNSVFVKMADVGIAMWAAAFLGGDYGYKGVLLIAVYYFLRNYVPAKAVCGAAWNVVFGNSVQYYGVFAVIPILLYNGDKGKSIKYLFYAFYPIHLLILYIISVILV